MPSESSRQLTPNLKSNRLHLLLFVLTVMMFLAGCRSVKFFEKEKLSQAVMTFDRDSISDGFEGKVFSVHEAGGGGSGDAAGGGCACGG
ncbi:MAG: DUF4266 domain-containing protein [Planctomycetota bacterium]|jgi:hypothetical protein